MDDPPAQAEQTTDASGWRLTAAYFEAWNKRDRALWLDQIHPDLELHPTALVGATHGVFHGIEGAGRYFDELIASGRTEQAEIVGLRRLGRDRFLIELELQFEGGSMASACSISQLRDSKFVYSSGYFSDAKMLASVGLVPVHAPPIARPATHSGRQARR